MCKPTTFLFTWNLGIALGSVGLYLIIWNYFIFQLLMLLFVGICGMITCFDFLLYCCCSKSVCCMRMMQTWNFIYCICFALTCCIQWWINSKVGKAACLA